MPITKAIDSVVDKEYVLACNEGECFEVVFKSIQPTSDTLIFSDTKTGYPVMVCGPIGFGMPQYTCYSEEDLDLEFVYDNNFILNPNTALDSLLGQTFSKVHVSDDAVHFYIEGKLKFKMCHVQECCESVYLGDITGDLDDLVGSPILDAKETYSYSKEVGECYFYDIRTLKGSVTFRFMHEYAAMYSSKASLIFVK